jgi:oligogalacturonide lyase
LLLSRRDFLALAAVGHISGPETNRYADPATDLPVVRLTDPAFASGMPAPHLRQFGRRSDTLLYWSERGGTCQAYLLNLKSGESKQLTEVAALDPASVTLSADERSIYFFDGRELNETSLANLKSRPLYESPEGSVRTGMTVASDASVLFAERTGGQSRIVRVLRQHTFPVSGVDGEIESLMARPRRPEMAWRAGDGVWLANLDGTGKQQLRLEPGQTGEILWTPLGHTLLYLHIPDNPKELITLREHSPADGVDKVVAKTSQFASVSSNGDASVFAGASRSKASAYVLILLRVTRRELTLCEHHASDPAMVSPVFSPDSQSIFFVSDRHGKAAIYAVRVEKFVEQTGDNQ